MAQNDDEQALRSILAINNEVEQKITDDVYYHHIIELNADKKPWGDAEGYKEKVFCYFIINDSSEIQLIKIKVVLEKEDEVGYQNFLYDEKEQMIMSYTDYYRNEERIGQQGAYFGEKSIAAVSVNNDIFIGDDLTDDMVSAARKFYLSGRRYKRMFETIVSLQLSK